MTKAVVLARGKGTRMSRSDPAARLTASQAVVAETGVKAMIPLDRPFLDYVLGALADAGYRRVCLVTGPEHSSLRDYYSSLAPSRVSVEFAVQPEAHGTADAVAAAEQFADADPFCVINSDNYYPVEVLRALRGLAGCGLAAFECEGMLRGNVPPERLASFAVVEHDADGMLVRIVEKPDDETLARLPPPVCVSMNCWRFEAAIFDACRAISPSPRGEYEIPDAVEYAMNSLGKTFRVLRFNLPVLDLSCRADVAAVWEKLSGTEVRL